MRRLFGVFMVVLMALGVLAAPAVAEVNAVTPSTNDANATKGWAHFNVVDDSVPGRVTLELVSTRGFASCFEYRSDGDTSEMIEPDNPNTDITDGLYPYQCVNNSTTTVTLYANEYVEVRMVFGAEKDERFDWTRVDVIPGPQTKDECMNSGYAAFGFSNQGDCIQFVNTGKDNR